MAYDLAQSGAVMQMGYGGQAGGGKTDLGLGLAGTVFRKTLFFRREFTQLSDVIERGNQIYPVTFVSGEKRLWRFNGRLIRLRGASHDRDWTKYQGQSNDLIVFDEAAEFTESQIRLISGWLRTTDENQHTLALLCFNPPTTPEGEWIVQMFAPWIDPQYSGERAEPGEVRWFARDKDDKEFECDSSEPFEYEGRQTYPISRTYFPASRFDNPYLGERYERQLDALPEPLRTMVMEGDFTVSGKPDQWQVLPTAWLLQAMERGRTQSRPDVHLRSVGVDVARGGADNTAIAKLYSNWFDPLLMYPGADTPDGMATARLVLDAMETPAPVFIDVIGWGASAYDQLTMLCSSSVTPINNAEAGPGVDLSGKYSFANLRAASYWRLREALDPLSGEDIALPDDRNLRVELAAPRYKIKGGRIQVEPKEDIVKRLGRSPDRADAVVMAWWGVVAPTFEMEWI
jgi:hypothetical protein